MISICTWTCDWYPDDRTSTFYLQVVIMYSFEEGANWCIAYNFQNVGPCSAQQLERSKSGPDLSNIWQWNIADTCIGMSPSIFHWYTQRVNSCGANVYGLTHGDRWSIMHDDTIKSINSERLRQVHAAADSHVTTARCNSRRPVANIGLITVVGLMLYWTSRNDGSGISVLN